jgi:hypothetical protein
MQLVPLMTDSQWIMPPISSFMNSNVLATCRLGMPVALGIYSAEQYIAAFSGFESVLCASIFIILNSLLASSTSNVVN